MLPSVAPELLPGDCLLYHAQGVFGYVISIKTWHPVAHCESYLGMGNSVASRDGLGVNAYPVRWDGLYAVLRPAVGFDLLAAATWFLSVQGQGYDWLGLLRFAWRAPFHLGDERNKMFCSEFLTRYYRQGSLDPFNGADADSIAPFQFLLSDKFTTVWSAANG